MRQLWRRKNKIIPNKQYSLFIGTRKQKQHHVRGNKMKFNEQAIVAIIIIVVVVIIGFATTDDFSDFSGSSSKSSSSKSYSSVSDYIQSEAPDLYDAISDRYNNLK